MPRAGLLPIRDLPHGGLGEGVGELQGGPVGQRQLYSKGNNPPQRRH